MTVDLSTAICPQCSVTLDAATGVTGAAIPKPGDVSLCFYCGTVLVFKENGVRRMREREWHTLTPDFQEMVARVRRAVAGRSI